MTDKLYNVDRDVVITGARFMNALTKSYGTERGMAVYDACRAVMGDEVAGAIMFGIMGNKIKTGIKIDDPGFNKISTIKEIRSFLNVGLKEAKDLSEGMYGIDCDSMSNGRYDEFIKFLNKNGAKYTFI